MELIRWEATLSSHMGVAAPNEPRIEGVAAQSSLTTQTKDYRPKVHIKSHPLAKWFAQARLSRECDGALRGDDREGYKHGDSCQNRSAKRKVLGRALVLLWDT
ncbi:Hypothetical predicted protein [Podarcis lilfordi]|uniref:Uncharacterized protein n=1 Tax=Podarcis lilfordi TaxID=74358 RepID=A0AA35LKG2_9SAUR|nr:Hypothetical predicted protein [Podarcis lilfordi]